MASKWPRWLWKRKGYDEPTSLSDLKILDRVIRRAAQNCELGALLAMSRRIGNLAVSSTIIAPKSQSQTLAQVASQGRANFSRDLQYMCCATEREGPYRV
ncbi:hypothetical protein HJFPF1_05205 [Paramyrothecium foliicola]|nr:hypothetical protein HJFPF1_05205 [Paramyrothecium foliicola]